MKDWIPLIIIGLFFYFLSQSKSKITHNKEVISWIDGKGKNRSITIDRQMQEGL